MTHDPQVRKLKRWLIITVAAGLLASLVIAFAWRFDADNRRAESCERAVKEAINDRAMWDYLLQTNDHPDDPKAIAFAAELNRRIPLLKCSRGSAIPAPISTTP